MRNRRVYLSVQGANEIVLIIGLKRNMTGNRQVYVSVQGADEIVLINRLPQDTTGNHQVYLFVQQHGGLTRVGIKTSPAGRSVGLSVYPSGWPCVCVAGPTSAARPASANLTGKSPCLSIAHVYLSAASPADPRPFASGCSRSAVRLADHTRRWSRTAESSAGKWQPGSQGRSWCPGPK
jgi:hypothetical protein